MADSTRSIADIPAPAANVLAVIADLANYPSWAGGIKAVDVLESDDAGRPTKARFTVDSGPVKDTYVLAYSWDKIADDATGTVSWTLVEGGITKKLDGAYYLAAAGTGTRVTYTLAVEIALALPGLLKRKAEKKIVETALKDLTKRVR